MTPSPAGALQEFMVAAALARVAAAIAPPPPVDVGTVDDLRKLELPIRQRDLLAAVLGPLGWVIEPHTIEDEYTFARRACTRVRAGGVEMIVIYLAGSVLDDPTPTNVQAISALQYAFRRGQRVFIASDLPAGPHLAFVNMIENGWRRDRGVQARFLRPRDLTDIETEPSAEMRRRMLASILDIADPLAGPPPEVLDAEDRRELTELIGDYPDFGGLPGREVLLQQAGVEDVVGNIDLSGAPRIVAGQVVQRLWAHGPLRSDGTHALGALLGHLYSRSDLPEAKAEFIRTVVAEYRLLHELPKREER